MPLFIDFNGLDEDGLLPLDMSYACQVRDHRTVGLYFGRRGVKGRRRRHHWKARFQLFVHQLEALERDPT